MGNNNAQLTPRGELVADVLTALLFVGMGYAIVRAVAVVVVKIGQLLGVI
jgi:signal transduction protein with GAF and PtsI domain